MIKILRAWQFQTYMSIVKVSVVLDNKNNQLPKTSAITVIISFSPFLIYYNVWYQKFLRKQKQLGPRLDGV